MQSKSFEDGSHAPLTFLMHVPPPCTPVCTCTQSWTQYSAQINKNNCLLSDSDWVSVISSVIEPYVVQFLDEITEVQRGEVDCPRSRNKEMVKAGLELWVWLTLESMLLVSFPTAILTTISANIIEWVLCVMDYGFLYEKCHLIFIITLWIFLILQKKKKNLGLKKAENFASSQKSSEWLSQMNLIPGWS